MGNDELKVAMSLLTQNIATLTLRIEKLTTAVADLTEQMEKAQPDKPE
jgi:prefoldin subunit 5